MFVIRAGEIIAQSLKYFDKGKNGEEMEQYQEQREKGTDGK